MYLYYIFYLRLNIISFINLSWSSHGLIDGDQLLAGRQSRLDWCSFPYPVRATITPCSLVSNREPPMSLVPTESVCTLTGQPSCNQVYSTVSAYFSVDFDLTGRSVVRYSMETVTSKLPSWSVRSSSSLSVSAGSSRVATWLPASSPAGLLKHVGPQGRRISFSFR